MILDTNAWLDLWYFEDSRTRALRADLERGRLRWLATPRMLDELRRVLRRPDLRQRPVAPGAAEAALHRARQAECCEAPAAPHRPGALRCRDASDQIFVELALQQAPAWLVSRDRALLKMARALMPQGVQVVEPARWPGVPGGS